MYLFHDDHPVRKAATKIANSFIFERISLAVVLGSCALLAIENPHEPLRKSLFFWLEAISLAFFVFEATVEIVDATLFEYLSHWNNATDLVVIVNTVLSLFGGLHAGVKVRLLVMLASATVVFPMPQCT